MSVHMIYYKDGAKMMRPVLTKEEYLTLRNSEQQKAVQGDEKQKRRLMQMNYSCLPNEDGTLKGSKTMSTTVGMDIDHIEAEKMLPLKERILAKKDELGLQMLEESARGGGYHLVFKRRPELSQEENLKWASELLDVEYDDGAKDITRVFFTTTEEELLYLSDEIFEIKGSERGVKKGSENGVEGEAQEVQSQPSDISHQTSCKQFPTHYHGIPFKDIIAKYWEVNNRGFEPTEGDRDTLTYQLACDLRHICGRNFEWLDQVIPCYDGFSIEEKQAKIKSALSSEFNGFPQRLRNTLNALQSEELRVKSEEFLFILH